jgi:hypothetical protein
MSHRTAVLGLALLGIAASLPVVSAEAPLPGKDICVFSSQVRGWKVLDEQTLLLDAPTGGNAYLIKLFGPVAGLQFHESLAFVDGDHNGQLCHMGDSLQVGGPAAQSVPITSVRLLTQEEAATLRAGDKKKPAAK